MKERVPVVETLCCILHDVVILDLKTWTDTATNTAVSNTSTAMKPIASKGCTSSMLQTATSLNFELNGIDRARKVDNHRMMKPALIVGKSANTARTRNRNNDELKIKDRT